VLQTASTDANGHTQYQYSNALGQIVEADSNLDGLRIQYEYDASGNLEKVYQPNKAAPQGAQDWTVTSLQYDLAGRKTSMDDPDMGLWEYGYDAIGNLTGQTDSRNVSASLSYYYLNGRRLALRVQSSQSLRQRLCGEAFLYPIHQALIPAKDFHLLIHVGDEFPIGSNELIRRIKELHVVRIQFG
jgi:YD repeat-containing protein